MRIILDSTSICADPHLGGAAWRVILENMDRLGLHLIIPKVVTDEAARFFADELKKQLDRAEKPVQRLRFLLRDDTQRLPTDQEIRDVVAAYKNWLESGLGGKATIVDYPAVPHEAVVKREIARRKPTRRSGIGYRDTLVWETVLTLAGDDIEPIVFISRNTEDFAGPDGRLHPDLQSDLAERGLPAERVLYFQETSYYVAQVLKPNLEELTSVREALGRGRYRGLNLAEWVDEKLPSVLAAKDLDSDDLGLQSEFENPTIESVQSLVNFEVNDVRRLPSEEYIVEISLVVEAEVHFFIFKSDYYILDERETPNILDADWNEHYVLAGLVFPLDVRLSIVLEPETGTVIATDVLEVSGEAWRLFVDE